MKRLLPLILILALLLSGCGGKTATPLTTAAPASTPEPTPTPTPKFAFTSQLTTLEEETNGLMPLFFSGEGFYASSMEKTGEKIPDDVVRAARQKGVEPVNDGRYDIYRISLYFVSLDGTVTKLDKYTQLPDEKNQDNWKEFKSVSDLCGMTEGDGKLITIEKTYASGSSAPDKKEDWDEKADYNEFRTKWYVRTLDRKTGKVLSSKEIINEDGAEFRAADMKYSGGKVFCVSKSDIGQGVTGINTDGTIDMTALYVGDVERLILLGNGSLAVQGLRGTEAYISALDSEEYVFTDMYRLRSDVENCFDGDEDYEFYYTRGLDFYGFDLNEAADERLFSWASVNVNPSRVVSEIRSAPGGVLYFIENEYVGGRYVSTLVRLERAPYDESTDRQVLLLYSPGFSYGINDAVANFNRSSTTTRIEIVDTLYGADIIDLSTMNYRELAASGKIEDLYPYIDADTEISRGDFFSNVLVALEVNGKLCQTVSGFSIDTVIGASSVVGDMSGWDYSSYYSTLAAKGPGCDPFDIYTTRDEIFMSVLAVDLDWFVDWENRYCNFDNDNFAAMLEFVNTFPEKFDASNHEWNDEEDNSDLRIANGKQMLLRASLYGFDDVCRTGFEFGEDITYVGYPTMNGSGNSLRVSTLATGENLAMSTSSAHKQEVWEFLRTFFTGEYQKKLTVFPVNVAVFNQKLEPFILDYLRDDDGKLMHDKVTGEPIKRALGTMYMSDFTQVSYYGLDDRGQAKLSGLVTSVSKVADYDEKVFAIVNAAAKDYFNGKISSAEAAHNVQIKMTEYLNVSVNEEQVAD